MEGGQYLAQAASFAQSAQCSPWILSKIALAGLHDLLSLVSYLCVRQKQPSDLEIRERQWLPTFCVTGPTNM